MRVEISIAGTVFSQCRYCQPQAFFAKSHTDYTVKVYLTNRIDATSRRRPLSSTTPCPPVPARFFYFDSSAGKYL